MSDKEELMGFIKNVWGGHDYIPRVWDDWLSNQAGKMFVVEVDGVPVGMNRVRFMEDGSAWFEGVRVHPSFRGRGLATLLGENSIRVAKKKGVKVFRLTSNSRNAAAHRQVARMGFGEVSRVSVYQPAKGTRLSSQRGVRRARMEDLRDVIKSVHQSNEYELGGGVLWDSFTVVSLTNEVIARWVKDGSVFLYDGAVAFAKPGREGSEVWNQVCFIAGDARGATRLVKHVFTSKGKYDWRIVYVPQGSPLIGDLRRAGLERAFSLILFERRTANG